MNYQTKKSGDAMRFRNCMMVAAAFLFLVLSSSSHAFMKGGGGGKCAQCHSLTRDEASILLEGAVDNVLKAEQSAVGGLLAVDIEKGDKQWPVYIDFSKQFLLSGQVIRLSSKENVTETRIMRLNAVDVSGISLKNAVVIGDPEAKRRIIEFSHPDCRFCAKIHEEAKKVVAKNPDVAFFVMLYSLNNNPGTVRKVRSIMCGKRDAPKLLDDAFAGKELPDPACHPSAVEDTARLAAKLNQRSTPAMILPDGRIITGYRDAETIL